MADSMHQLTRREEQVLISVWNLKDEAYLVSIRKYLTKITDRIWSIGSIHKPLIILEKGGYLEFYEGDATPTRGGRSKKIYTLTNKGLAALNQYKKVNDSLWSEFTGMELSR